MTDEKRVEGFKEGHCPRCNAEGDFSGGNYTWDGDEIYYYFVCPKCGAACCDYYDVTYTMTDANWEDLDEEDVYNDESRDV
jgi:hypothetical protein